MREIRSAPAATRREFLGRTLGLTLAGDVIGAGEAARAQTPEEAVRESAKAFAFTLGNGLGGEWDVHLDLSLGLVVLSRRIGDVSDRSNVGHRRIGGSVRSP